MRLPKLGLKSQILFSFLAVSLLLLSVSSYFVYRQMVSQIKYNLEKTTSGNFRQMAFNLDQFMGQVDKVFGLIMTDDAIRDLIESRWETDIEKTVVQRDVIDRMTDLINTYDFVRTIYLMTEDGRIFGIGSDTAYGIDDAAKSHPLYHSEPYRRADEAFPRAAWIGGVEDKLFALQGQESSREGSSLISASRGIRIQYGTAKVATAILNVDQQRFNAIFNHNYDPSSSVYLMDDAGTIISHHDASLIGSRSAPFVARGIADNQGSFTYSSGSSQIQYIYYRMEANGWTLVNEIPLKEYTRDISKIRNVLIAVFAAGLVLSVVISAYLSKRITRPLFRLTRAMKKMEYGQLGLTLPEAADKELNHIMKQFNLMSASVKDLVEQVGAIKEEKKRRELEALQAQINPHFLYNTLNNIKWLASSRKTDEVVDCVNALGKLLRQVFRNFEPVGLVEEEIRYLESYVEIMRVRFGDAIRVEFAIPPDLRRCQVTRFSIQPLIENAISHGFSSGARENARIRIEASSAGRQLYIRVTDNGVGMKAERLEEVRATLHGSVQEKPMPSGSIGLANVHRRIQLHYGEPYGLSLESKENGGTEATLAFPLVYRRTEIDSP